MTLSCIRAHAVRSLLTLAFIAALPPTVANAQAPSIEAITSYDRMAPGAPHNGFFNNAWQPFVAQSSRITRIGVTVGNPSLPAGGAVPFNVNIRLCTTQPDANGNCGQVLGQASPQIINYGNTYADVGDIPVTPGVTYWAVWFQPAAANATTWVTFWWAGGATIGTSDQLQMVVRGYNPAPAPPEPPPPVATPAPPTPQDPQEPSAFRYAVANVTSVNLRTGPGTNYPTFPAPSSLAGNTPIDIVCQTVGTNVNGSTIWDQLTNGAYLSDWYTTTPVVGDYSPGIPRCAGASPSPTAPGYRITATTTVNTRLGPGSQFAVAGSFVPGALVDISCQTYGSFVLGSPIWDKLTNGQYVSDYWVSTPVYGGFSPGISVCPGTGPRPTNGAGAPAIGGSGAVSSPPGSGSGLGIASGPAAATCRQDVVFIGARGSGEGDHGFGDTVYAALGPIIDKFGSAGRVARDSLPKVYPAMSVPDGIHDFSGYQASVASGTAAILRDMALYLSQFQGAHCRGTMRFFLVGYSQGAWAVGDAYLEMAPDLKSHVAGIALFGDPRYHGDLFRHGIYDRGHPWAGGISGSVWNSCRLTDPVCHATGVWPAQFVFGAHFRYADPGQEAVQAGHWLAGRIQ